MIRCERELNKLENIEDEEILEQIKNNIINSFTKLLFDEIQGHTNTIYNKPTNIHLKNFDESQGILEKNFEEFWDNINIHAGQEFFTKTNREFTYNVEGEYLIASDKKVFIPKVNFHQAFNVWPVDGPGSLPKNIMGKSYVWGICEDNRSWIDNRLDWFLN